MNYNKRKKGTVFDYFVALCTMMLFFAGLWIITYSLPFTVYFIPVLATVSLLVAIWRIYNKENYIFPLTLTILIVGIMLSLMFIVNV